MQRDSRAYLWDVRQAVDTILDFVAGIDRRLWTLAPQLQLAPLMDDRENG